MAIVSFWSSRKQETNQSISAISSALQMGIDRNLKILLIDTAFADDTYDKCFNQEESSDFVKNLNRGKLDISSGVEGLILAVTSNKSSPEIIQNYTQPILKGRLDLLAGMATKNKDQYRAGYVNYPDIVEMADKYYDLVIVDLAKGYGDKVVTKILAMSDIIVVTFDQDKELIYDFEKLWGKDPLFSPKERVVPLLTKEDRFSIYNNNNVARRIKMSPGMPSIIYNTQLMEAVQIGEAARFFINLNIASDTSRNKLFLDVVADLNMLLIDRIQQQKYKGSFNKNSVDETIRDHIKYMNKERQEVKEEQEKIEAEIEKQMGDGNTLQNINENIEKNIQENNVNPNVNNLNNLENLNQNNNISENSNADFSQNVDKNTNLNTQNQNEDNTQSLNQNLEQKNGQNFGKNVEQNLDQNLDQNQNNVQNPNSNLDLSLNPNEEEDKKEEKGILGFFKNIFGNKDKEKENQDQNQNVLNEPNLNKNINENQINNENQNNLNLGEQNKEENIAENNNQDENKIENIENNANNENQKNIINNLDEMSIEAARNIKNQLNQQNNQNNESNSNINNIEEDHVGEALSEAEKIMLENQKLLKKLEEEAKLNEEKGKTTSLDFSGIKPLKQEGINKTDLYNIDDSGKIDYDEENNLLDQNLNEVEEKIERDKPKKAIDFSKIKPLSAEKDEIEMKKHQEIQEKIKSKLLQEENTYHGVMTQAQRAEMMKKQTNAEKENANLEPNLNSENVISENVQKPIEENKEVKSEVKPEIKEEQINSNVNANINKNKNNDEQINQNARQNVNQEQAQIQNNVQVQEINEKVNEAKTQEEITENKTQESETNDKPMFNPILGMGLNDENNNLNAEENNSENNKNEKYKSEKNKIETNEAENKKADSIDDLL